MINIGAKASDQAEKRLAIMEKLAKASFMCYSWRGITILVQHPVHAAFDDVQRLHRTDGPALEFSDSYGVYAVHGIRLSPELGARMAAGIITATEIRDQANAEVRRVLIAEYNTRTHGGYLRDVGATVIHQDVDALGLPRRLLKIDQPGDETYLAIEVTNSTPEPDGSRKLYTFRCHPELKPLPIPGIRTEYGPAQDLTCQNAIASTYGYLGKDFNLAVQT